MKPHPRRFAPIKLARAGAVSVGVLLLTPATHGQVPCGGYEVTATIQAPECPPFGFPPTIGTAISEPIDGGLPNVVGYYQSCTIGPDTAFLWIGNEDKFITLPMPPGTIRSWAFDITPDGAKIAGSFDLDGDGLGNLAFLYDHETGKFTNLSTLPGGNWSEALAINANGVATGFWGNNNIGPWQVFLWKNGEMIDIGPQLNGPHNMANDISDTGDRIVGWMGTSPNIDSHAFIWDDGRLLDLGVIPGGVAAAAMAINNQCEVAGRAVVQKAPLVRHAFLWSAGKMIDLGTLPGYPDSVARGINEDSIVVGHSFGSDRQPGHACIWQNGVVTDLNDLIPSRPNLTLLIANAINQTGQITGQATRLRPKTQRESGSWPMIPLFTHAERMPHAPTSAHGRAMDVDRRLVSSTQTDGPAA